MAVTIGRGSAMLGRLVATLGRCGSHPRGMVGIFLYKNTNGLTCVNVAFIYWMCEMNARIKQFCFGKPEESLTLERVPLRDLEKDKVRVRVEAANINPSDLLSIYGVGQYRRFHKPPRVPGFEAAGKVVESNHPGYSAGQRVLLAASGAWQEYIDALPDNIFHIPQDLESGYACQLYINSLTAWAMTTEVANLSERDVVIINAGRSAIGKIFSQLSSSLGYTVIVITSSPENYPYQSNYVLSSSDDFCREIVSMGLPRPNIAFDAIGGGEGEKLLFTLCDKGRFINYGTLSLSFYGSRFFECLRDRQIDFRTFFLRHWESSIGKDSRRENFKKMLDHFMVHKVSLDVDRYVPFEEFKFAMNIAELRSKSLFGKLVFTPD